MASASAVPSSSERLSALVDGELDPSAAASACADWRRDGEARTTWHRYQLIGDLLRSDELASTAAHDEAFLLALRSRLALEPVVLAPEPLPLPEPLPSLAPLRGAGPAAARRGRGAWIASGAVAAGFVAVAGALLATRAPQAPDASGTASTLAAAPVAGTPQPVVLAERSVPAPAPAASSEPEPAAASGQLIRDARLDRYLAAHKQFAGSSALGVPSALLRNATADASGR